MYLLSNIEEILKETKEAFDNAPAGDYSAVERNGFAGNMLALSDNVPFMKYLISKGLKGKIQMIYADPPFLSDADYDATLKAGEGTSLKHLAYKDTWKNNEEEYLRFLCTCLWGMKELLSEEGTIWLHLDWHIVHYMKVIMDEIFGRGNFINEIIWQYKSGGSSSRHFARKHDTILLYGKSDKYYLNIPKEKSYNRDLKPYNFKNVTEYQDEYGWYTLVNMKDVWAIDMVGRTSSERTGYATQKPEKLLSLIVESASREGDICADFFCGSGTLPYVCGKNKRRFMAADSGMLATSMTRKRLLMDNMAYEYLVPENELAETMNENPTIDVVFITDGATFDIELKKYRPNQTGFKLNKKDEDSMNKLICSNPLALVDSWSIDTNYDGRIHKNQASFMRGKDMLQTKFSGKYTGNISIVVRDIFGGEAHWVSKG